MRNLTSYSDQYILGLMEDCNINPHKATANVQLSMQSDGTLVECLNIWQELPNQFGWDEIVQLVFSEEKRLIDFCDDMHISAWNAGQMIEFWNEEYDPNDFHVERRYMEELLYDKMLAEMQAEYEETLCSLRY